MSVTVSGAERFSISLQGIAHTYGRQRVLTDIDLSLEPGELLCVLGPSGGGKSTLLKLVAGLETLQEGKMQLGDMGVTPENCPPPDVRPIGLVFQEHALFPHLSVQQNLEFGLSHLSKQQRQTRVAALLGQIELEDLKDRLPATLSGGQQQRVALARALAPQPEVLLLDEPFASVDVLLKNRLREEMRGMLKALGSTSLLVTHDPEDALMVADRIAVIVAGKLVQIGTPEQLWRSPEHPFVAEMFARQQIIRGKVEGDKIIAAFGEMAGISHTCADQSDVLLALDSLQVQVHAAPAGTAKVEEIRFAGEFYQIRLVSGSEQLLVRSLGQPELSPGQSVMISVAPDSAQVYNCE